MYHTAISKSQMFDFIENSISSAIMVSSDTSTEDILKILEEQEKILEEQKKNDSKMKKI